MDQIGERVKYARKQAGLTQLELGAKAKISKAAVSQIESGSTKSPTAATLLSICEVTGFSPKWIIHGKGEKRVNSISLDHDLSVRELELLWATLSPESKTYIRSKL